ncbi:hypothetical protein VHEMI01487 [[Torrubiella] hemipterigena]|uniref:Peroxisomal adenine nucleotide transporter 1 n=1 Tax=[Torrubiella] hemipterigena TaxID=1531966 RepID=A0A0A1ST67_9HYPO|nr:hypothetical protein VHEMI01487 [[Torrubiella] hemipterigena]
MVSQQVIQALGHAASGSLGTGISTAVLAPLDLVNMRLKVQRQQDGGDHYDGIIDAFRKIIKNEGMGALYRGASTDIAKSLIDSFLFFGFYNYFRQRNRHPKIWQELAYGAVAGACAKACTTPLANVVARKQTSETDKSMAHTLREIRAEGGIAALWSGYSATLVLTLNPSLTFLINRRLADKIVAALEEEDIPVAWIAFLLAATSKAIATAATYPFQAAKAHLQLHDQPEEDEKNGKKKQDGLYVRLVRLFRGSIFGLVVALVAKDGFRALYDGMQGEILKGFVSHGLTMAAKGFTHRLMVKAWLAAKSKRVASRV